MSDPGNSLQLLQAAFTAVIPAFGWILTGAVIRRLIRATEHWFTLGNNFVFYLGMPMVLAFSASRLDFQALAFSGYVLAGTLSFTAVVVIAYLYTGWQGISLPHRGVVAQGAYRANLAIIGLALCASAFGQQGLILASMPTAIWTVMFNIIAVILLGHTHGGHGSALGVIKSVVKNPLIIGTLVGVLVSVSELPVPAPLQHSGVFLAQTVIPFALVCLGGSISLRSVRSNRVELVSATLWRLVVAPVITVLVCLALGVRGIELGVAFLLLGGPAAVACHVMVTAMGGNGRLAANIVMVTTLLAPLTLTFGLFVLSALSLLKM